MAKTSWINRNERKRATVKKYAANPRELKAKKDYAGLTQLPRDASPTRVVNRCEVTGRRRAFIRRFKVSRLTFRELARRDSSWRDEVQLGKFQRSLFGCAARARKMNSLLMLPLADAPVTQWDRRGSSLGNWR